MPRWDPKIASLLTAPDQLVDVDEGPAESRGFRAAGDSGP